MFDKVTTFLKISLVENDEIVLDESKVANSFGDFFENAIHSLGVKTNEHSNDNYGLKIHLKLLLKNMGNIQVSILSKKILQTIKAFISYQLSRRAF